MAKEKKDKSEKKEKKEKRAEKDGVHKSKKDKKEKVVVDTAALESVVENGDTEELKVVVSTKPMIIPVGALVPFANPLADEKTGKKVLKGVKKGTYMPTSRGRCHLRF